MKRLIACISLLVLCITALPAFQDPVEIARINETSIWSDEFLYAFKKNRDPNTPVNKDSLLNYLDRYIDFKLKVKNARARGIDTTTAFRQEYEGYIRQVSKPYMDNHNKLEDLIAEAYQRSLYEVKAAHILIPVPANASPADTLAAYQKLDSIRTLTNNGIDFGLLAKQHSADGTARNGGDLGWFSVFTMVYPFESAAYNTEPGKISPVVKSQFGYHLVKPTDKRESRGRVRTSHIFVARNSHSYNEGKALIEKVYDSLKNGGSWNVLCKQYSEDTRSKAQNGALPMAGLGQLPIEYLDYAFQITEVGTYTYPVETPYGWHIIRLDGKEEVPSFEKAKAQLTEGVKRSGRLQFGEQEALKKLKQRNGFKLYNDAVAAMLDSLKKHLGKIDEIPASEPKLLFELGGKKIYDRDFYQHISEHTDGAPTRNFNSSYQGFEEKIIFDYEDSLAVLNYPEYRLLLQEYEEGLLLFEIMEDRVWNHAVEDSTGLKNYFTQHQNDYPAPERAVTWVISANSNHADSLLAKAHSILENASDTSQPDSLIKAGMTAGDYSLLKIAKRTFTRDDLPIFASGEWSENQLVWSASKDRLYLISEILPTGFYTLPEIKGRVTADYQDHLDQEWVKSLRKTNKVRIFKKRLASLLPIE